MYIGTKDNFTVADTLTVLVYESGNCIKNMLSDIQWLWNDRSKSEWWPL